MGFRHIGFIHMHTTISRALYELKTSVQRRIFKKSPHNFHTCLSSHVSHTIDGLFFIFHLLRRGLLCFVAHIIIFRLVFFLFISFSLYLSQIYGTHITHERKRKNQNRIQKQLHIIGLVAEMRVYIPQLLDSYSMYCNKNS